MSWGGFWNGEAEVARSCPLCASKRPFWEEGQFLSILGKFRVRSTRQNFVLANLRGFNFKKHLNEPVCPRQTFSIESIQDFRAKGPRPDWAQIGESRFELPGVPPIY